MKEVLPGNQLSKNNEAFSQINSDCVEIIENNIKQKTKKSIGSVKFFQKISAANADEKVNFPPESSSSSLPSQDE